MKGLILSIAISVAVIAGLIIFSKFYYNRESGGNNPVNPAWVNGILSAEETAFDFGNVSMANGNVTHVFKVKNIGTDPVVISKIYTSCMCTKANFIKSGENKGPFGMPGHSYVPSLSEVLNPGEEAQVEVIFDPAAHGPAGIGQIERAVSLENSGKGEKLDLSFSANVMP